MSTVSHLGDHLRRLRGTRTLYKIEQETDISRGLLSRYERGLVVPDPDRMKKLAAFYGVEYRELLLKQAED